MASPIEKSIQEAKDELDRVKEEGGVTVNIPEQGIVRKAVSSIEEEMEYEEPATESSDNEIQELEEEINGGQEREVKADSEGKNPSGSMLSGVMAKLGFSKEEDHVSAGSGPQNPVSHSEIDLDTDRHTETTPEPETDMREIPVGSVKEDIQTGQDEEDTGGEDSSNNEVETEVEENVSPGNNIEGELIQDSMNVPDTSTDTETREPSSKVKDAGPTEEENVLDDLSETDAIERQLKDLEEKIVEEESEELGKLAELEKRVEQLELEDRGVEERIARLNDRIRSMKPPAELDDRMTELEEVLMNPENHLENLVNRGMKDRMDELEKDDSKLEAEIERIAKQQQELQESVDELKEAVEGVDSNEEKVQQIDDKVERLWEAFDQELTGIEDRIHDNQSEVEEVTSQLVQLSELVKQAMHQ